ncbi:7-cyano-7-deazaguanine synthase [Waddlia chondrophila 2032/99]|uniref:7-cyano-7-deazaguanine synthase n=2 Tax=Waddlia chondrophila TaxID=71667 RepID=D6YWT9_WADCW|nr:7-cyano-7-deazaguanine synthase QueC [Waddlia chondrophila]ADI38600.1 Queuosine biosynthesis protein QueC [Waddlia chondrophila WSU 86-1044]CCB91697.1 7-cyano-7-deazaguanine synthase [Waddlia chondrophila 2032/99]
MKAIVLLSGGIDSTVVLAMAQSLGRECTALSFDYGQRHKVELEHAAHIAHYYKVPQIIINISPACFENTALVNALNVPKNRTLDEISKGGIPSTYVPARNTLFLAYAAGQAEIMNAEEIHCGPNLLDRNCYPDCRPEFYSAFQQVLASATKQGAEGNPPRIVTPLINWDKNRIVQEGRKLGAPLDTTFSCYSPSAGKACGMCDACILRQEAL